MPLILYPRLNALLVVALFQSPAIAQQHDESKIGALLLNLEKSIVSNKSDDFRRQMLDFGFRCVDYPPEITVCHAEDPSKTLFSRVERHDHTVPERQTLRIVAWTDPEKCIGGRQDIQRIRFRYARPGPPWIPGNPSAFVSYFAYGFDGNETIEPFRIRFLMQQGPTEGVECLRAVTFQLHRQRVTRPIP